MEFTRSNKASSIKRLELGSLVSFDLNMEKLQVLLSSLISTVNHHSECIEHFSRQDSRFVTHSDLLSVVSSLSEPLRSASSKPSNLPEAVDSITSKISELSDSIDSNKEHTDSLQNALTEIKENLGMKTDSNKLRKTKQKFVDKLENKVSVDSFLEKSIEMKNSIQKLQDFVTVQSRNMENSFKDLETNTIWKIKDCEQMLKSRVNEQYVIDAFEKMSSNLPVVPAKKNSSSTRKDFRKLEEQINSVESNLLQKYQIMNRSLSETAEQLKEAIYSTIHSETSHIDPVLSEFKQNLNRMKEKVCAFETTCCRVVSKAEFENLKKDVDGKAEKTYLDVMAREFNKIPKNPEKLVSALDFQHFKDEITKKFTEILKNAKENKQPPMSFYQSSEIFKNFNALEKTIQEQKKDIKKELSRIHIDLNSVKTFCNNKTTTKSSASTKTLPQGSCLSCGRNISIALPFTNQFIRNNEKFILKSNKNTDSSKNVQESESTNAKNKSLGIDTRVRPQSALVSQK